MSNLRISVDEVIADLGLDKTSVMVGENKVFMLSQEHLDSIINAVGQRISLNYSKSHQENSGDQDDLMLGGMIQELNETFSDNNTNTNKAKIKM
jgi:hypothetical protein